MCIIAFIEFKSITSDSNDLERHMELRKTVKLKAVKTSNIYERFLKGDEKSDKGKTRFILVTNPSTTTIVNVLSEKRDLNDVRDLVSRFDVRDYQGRLVYYYDAFFMGCPEFIRCVEKHLVGTGTV